MKTLKQEKRWCVWRRETRDDKTTKIPYQVNGAKARSDDPATWTDYPTAKAALNKSNGFYDGIGLFFSKSLCGIDIDGSHDGGGDRNPLEVEVLDMFPGTYAEKSPSGAGVHILFLVDQARLPSETVTTSNGAKVVKLDRKYYLKNTKIGLEFYAGGLTNRFFTFTENQISDSDEVIDKTEAVLAFLEKYMVRGEPVPTTSTISEAGCIGWNDEIGDGDELTKVVYIENRLRAARRAKNGEKFVKLYDNGDTSDNNNDDSAADLALCVMLSFWFNADPEMIDTAFRKSKLYRPKWDERHGAETYGEMTIRKAVEGTSDTLDKGVFVHKPEDLTDAGNAELFAKKYGNKVRWCDSLGWLVWNGSVWNADDHAAEALALDLSSFMLVEALAAVQKNSIVNSKGKTEVDATAKAYLNHAMKTRAAGGIRNMMTLAKTRLAIKAADLDSNPYILNTAAGIVDLRTGKIQPHDPNAFCTKIAPFVPGRSEHGEQIWSEFLELVTMGDADLKKYLQITGGMSIIGSVKEEKIQIAFGGGRNGKSTYFNTLQNVLGNYAGTLNADVLTTDRNVNKGASLATLRGKRLVVCGELEEGQRLSIKELKRVATTDRLVIEQKYKDPEEIRPSHHVCMFTNHLPRVGSTDAGTWRRLAVIPFNAVMPEGEQEIKDYAEVLTTEAGGVVLLWLIRGAMEFLANGCRLKTPDSVKQVTDDYKQKENWIEPFIRERCSLDPAAVTQANKLYQAYKEFAIEAGDSYVHNGREFKDALTRISGIKNVSKEHRSFWKGIRLDPRAEFEKYGFEPTDRCGGDEESGSNYP